MCVCVHGLYRCKCIHVPVCVLMFVYVCIVCIRIVCICTYSVRMNVLYNFSILVLILTVCYYREVLAEQKPFSKARNETVLSSMIHQVYKHICIVYLYQPGACYMCSQAYVDAVCAHICRFVFYLIHRASGLR